MSTLRWLGIALAVQAALVVVTWWPAEPEAIRPLIGISRADVTELEVSIRSAEGEAEEPLRIAREGEGWVLRSEADYPAETAQVEALLDAVVGLRAGPPVATRDTSHEALLIDDAGYGRKLRVASADTDETWLLAPATSRSVYARRAGDDTVYRAAGSSEWAFRERAATYRDAEYVSDDAGAFDALAVENAQGSLRFERRDGAWTLAELSEGETADAAAIEQLASQVATLRLSQPVGRDVLPEHGLDGSVRVDWTISGEDQSISGGYAVGADVESDAYVKAVDHPFVVRVARSQVSALRDATREQFLLGLPAEPAIPTPVPGP